MKWAVCMNKKSEIIIFCHVSDNHFVVGPKKVMTSWIGLSGHLKLPPYYSQSVAEIVLLCIITTLVTQRLLSFAVSWSNIENLGHPLLTINVHISTLNYSNAVKYSLDDIANRYGIVLNHRYCIKSLNHKRYERWRTS
jgi:hypothetical protein